MIQNKQKFISSTISSLVLLAVVLSALLFSGCESAKPTKADRDEVRAVMEMRQKAISTKDIELYKKTIVADYNDIGVTFDTLIEVMQSNFDNNKAIEFTFKRSMVDMSMNSARMVGEVTYKVAGDDKTVFDQEHTIFRRINGEWRISGGIKVISL